MLFKIFTIGALIYLFYRMSFAPKKIEETKSGQQIDNNPKNTDDDYIDYEEVD
ncbi:MAG: hypothetical protein AAF990_00195 [Bacteroidota bacterium]